MRIGVEKTKNSSKTEKTELKRRDRGEACYDVLLHSAFIDESCSLSSRLSHAVVFDSDLMNRIEAALEPTWKWFSKTGRRYRPGYPAPLDLASTRYFVEGSVLDALVQLRDLLAEGEPFEAEIV